MMSVYLRLAFVTVLLALGLLIGVGGSLQAARPGAAPTPATAVPTLPAIPTPVPTLAVTPPPAPSYSEGSLPFLSSCPATIPGLGSRLFSQTGHAITGVFLDYWDLHGGLVQEGYPISEVRLEASDLDGMSYEVQYFERAVFEYHPENQGTPYEVLLAQLGTYQYQQKYPTGAPNQRPNGERPRYFAQTGHTLGGEFRLYWESHGGLEQQGYPLSDEFTEISPLDGKPYTVQYFERAVMEYHPENVNPYRVLLSQLGTLRLRTRAPAGLTPTPTPAPARYLGDITGDTGGLADYAVGGGALYWFDGASPYGASTLLRYDLAAGQVTTVVPLPPSRPGAAHRAHVVTDGRTLAWREEPGTSASPVAVIQGFDLQTGQDYAPVSFAVGATNFAVDGDILYYLRPSSATQEVRAHSWATGQDTVVAQIEPGTTPTQLVAGNGYVVWAEGVGSQYVLRLASARHPGTERVLSTPLWARPSYVIAGDRVIWSATPVEGQPDETLIQMYTLASGATTTLVREATLVDSLSADGDRLAWRRVSNPDPMSCLSMVVLDLRAGLLQTGVLPGYGGRQVTLLGPNTLVYPRLGEPFQLYLQPLQ